MIDQNRLEKYAELAIVKGVNLQKDQILIINTSIDAVEMTRACVKSAYEHGAKQVLVNYRDEYISRYDFLYQTEETLCDIRKWQIDSKLDYLKEGACVLHIVSDIPGIMKDVPADKLSKRSMAMASANKEAQDYTMANKTQWCIVAVPNKEWAKLVFPEFEDDDAAVEELWERILSCVHVTPDNDPIEEWTQLNESFQKRVDILNGYQLKELHFKNSLGTDLQVKLVDRHIWAGGCDVTVGKNISFNPNMPTEEIFTTPHRSGVNGKVVASKPLDYNGTLIKDFWFVFEDGKVVDYDAKAGKEALKSLVEFDEGSCRLGEVALVPFASPISQSGILFYNTLFDENASCHLALGSAYPANIEHGTEMSEEELLAHDVNQSYTHVDFMFGNEDMEVIGQCVDGTEVSIFKEGNFVF